jgi:hypothetical protein
MNRSVIGDAVSRRVNPLFFLVALICFFFTFASVSCNTSAAQGAVSGLSGLGGSGSSGSLNSAQVTACLQQLNNLDLISYSGMTLVFGQSPSTLSQAPGACQNGVISPSGSAAAASTPNAGIGVQPLALIAFVIVLLGLLTAAAAAVIRVAPRLRLLGGMLLGLIAFFVLLVNQFHLHSAIDGMLDAQTAGSGAPFSVAPYFTIKDGIAWYIALVALALVTLYSAAAYLGLSGPLPVPLEPAVPLTGEAHPPA